MTRNDRDLYNLRAKYTRFRILVIGRANAHQESYTFLMGLTQGP